MPTWPRTDARVYAGRISRAELGLDVSVTLLARADEVIE